MADFTYLLRPKTFDDVVGQPHLCSADAPLRSLCENNNLTHSFFYGPPGCGKTTLARIIADVLDAPFYEFNATSLKVEQLRKIFDQYEGSLTKPLVFIDEVHRLAKNQQEVLLPVMEKNSVLVIGASTENPYFSLTAAMRSRSLLFELHSIGYEALEALLVKACDKEGITLDEEAREYLIASSGGDARAMLKLLEVSTALKKPITLELLKSLRPAAQSLGSSEAGVHYDLASALIKSIRGSDPDAAIYYLARLIEGGEPPEFIARRLVILASEDVGNANPQALTLCTSAMTSVKMIGYPESRIILAQAVIYLCASPKSNSAYNAINAAQSAVKNGVILDIPEHLRQQHKGYLYPHDFGGWVEQKYLSKPLKFVEFKNSGYEAKMGEWIEKVWGK
ncbi:replication-associated recombination protein A [Sulfuricurvum sp.]|uniref:replication-associated recombination protein A n=1 Tax=Sulfuricurvum sp. TaxID=2025608 RepID=UPI003BB0CA13